MQNMGEIAMNSEQKAPERVRVPAQPVKKTYEYFEDIKAEFKRISWTDGEEVMTYAKAVVLSTFTFGLLIYASDLLIHRVLFGFDTIFKWLVG